MWKTLNGEPIDDILGFVERESAGDFDVHIGTDSLRDGKYTQFCTVVCIHKAPKGGRVACKWTKMTRIDSLREKLFREVWFSVELGLKLHPSVPEGKLTVHIDASAVKTHKSSKYVEELVGLVMGQGFKALYKPDAWAAQHVADHSTRVAAGVRRRPPRRRKS